MSDQILDLIPDIEPLQERKVPNFKSAGTESDFALDAIPDAIPARVTALDNISAVRELGVQPDTVLRERELAKQTGLPEAVVRENKQTVEARAWTEAADAWLMEAPSTSRFLADPKNAMVAHDDVQGLSDLERRYGTIRSTTADDVDFLERMKWIGQEGLKNLVSSSVGSIRGLFEFFAQKDREAMESLPPDVREKIIAQRGEAEEGVVSGALQVLPEDAAKSLTEAVRSEKLTPDNPLPTSGMFQQYMQDVGLMAPQIGAQIAAALVGGVPLSMGFMSSQIMGAQANELLDKGVSPDRALAAGFFNTIIQAPLESLSIGRMTNLIKGGAVTAPFLEALKVVGTEFFTEWTQKYPEAFTNIWAQAEMNEQDAVDVVNQFSNEFWEVTKEGIYEGLVAAPFGGIMGSPAIINTYVDARQAQQVQEWRDQQTDLHTAIQASATMQRDPETMKAFGQILGLGEEVWIDAEALHQRGPEFLQRIGVDVDAVAKAAQDGSMVKVNTSQVMYEAEYPDLLQDLRPSPSAMSAREAATYDPVQALKEIEEITLGEEVETDPLESEGEWSSVEIEVDGSTATAGEVMENIRSRMSEYQKFVECMK